MKPQEMINIGYVFCGCLILFVIFMLLFSYFVIGKLN